MGSVLKSQGYLKKLDEAVFSCVECQLCEHMLSLFSKLRISYAIMRPGTSHYPFFFFFAIFQFQCGADMLKMLSSFCFFVCFLSGIGTEKITGAAGYFR